MASDSESEDVDMDISDVVRYYRPDSSGSAGDVTHAGTSMTPRGSEDRPGIPFDQNFAHTGPIQATRWLGVSN